MKKIIKNKKRTVILTMVFVVMISLMIFFLNKNDVKYYGFEVNNEMNEKSEKMYKKIKKTNVLEKIEKNFFNSPNTYYVLEKTDEYAIILIKTFYHNKRIKEIKETEDGLEIKIKETRYTSFLDKIKQKYSSGLIMKPSYDLIVKVESNEKIKSIRTNMKEEELYEVDLTRQKEEEEGGYNE